MQPVFLLITTLSSLPHGDIKLWEVCSCYQEQFDFNLDVAERLQSAWKMELFFEFIRICVCSCESLSDSLTPLYFRHRHSDLRVIQLMVF